jgi:hypothetical protein
MRLTASDALDTFGSIRSASWVQPLRFCCAWFRFGFHATSRCAKARATASGSRSITNRSANASDGIEANTAALGEFRLRQVHAFAR